jgi:hypothetical protein
VENKNTHRKKNLPNAEKCKYVQVNIGRYLTAAETGSISYSSTM